MIFRFRSTVVAALLTLLCLSSQVQSLAQPSQAHLSNVLIKAAREYSSSHDGIALIIKQHGQVLFEDYYNGYQGEPLHIFSGTKSFFGVLAVMAQDDRLLSLDERVSETLPEWRSDRRKSQITIRDLLNFTSGLEAGALQIYGQSSHDKISLSVSLQATRERGRSFVYGPSHLNVFCEVLRRKLKPRKLSYEEYLRLKLIDPLGIEITKWRRDSRGNPFPSAGMRMTGKDWIRLGELVSSGGIWNGQRLVRKESLEECFSGTVINPSFGLCFWLNRYSKHPDAREVNVEKLLELDPLPEDWSSSCLSKNAPSDLVVSLGSNFQRLYIIPSLDLIVVHLGKSGRRFRDSNFLENLFSENRS